MIVSENQTCPVYEQKCEPCEQTIKININYLCPLGFLRIFLLFILFGGNLSAWLIPKDQGLFYLANGMFSSTRTGYLVLSSIDIGLSVFFFVISVTNYVNLPAVRSSYWLVLICAFDSLALLSMLAIGITASVREAQVPVQYFTDTINQGAFASAGFFALFSTVLYLISILVSIPYLSKLFENDDEECNC